MKMRWLIAPLMIAMALLSSACVSSNEGSANNSLQAAASVLDSDFTVRSIEIKSSQDGEYEVEAWISGQLYDTCKRIREVRENRQDKNISLSLRTWTTDNPGCEEDEVVEFIQIAVLSTEGLADGTYIVTGDSGTSASFDVDNEKLAK